MNNRQAGRRRGRGGQRPNGGGSNQGNGSRIDNRARGNAAQLLEKYKNLARDAQMQGDRVNTEYYLQFADHYFRVLNENRSRFEEQNRRHSQDGQDEDGDEDGFELDGEEGEIDAADSRPQRREQRPDREQRADRQQREERRPRGDDRQRGEQRGGGQVRSEAGADEAQGEAGEAQAEQGEDRSQRRRTRRPRAESAEAAGTGDQPAAIDSAVLPPSIGTAGAPAEPDTGEEDDAKPRRRGRKPRAETADEGANAA
ncbi:DUF4167 domain-containing protein [Sphingomonas sp. CJ99]